MPAKIVRYCKRCGAEFFGHKSKVYCSAECRAAGRPPPWNKGKTGIPANRQKNGANKICPICGKVFYKPKCRVNRPYCSPECYFTARWGDGRRITNVCQICGKKFEGFASEPRKTCSPECLTEYMSWCRRGEKSHLWRGGKTAPYHKDWRQARRKALKRDGNKCVLCSNTQNLNVHHIIPYRYSKSHDLDNLITLCRSCHSREEWKINAARRKKGMETFLETPHHNSS